MSAMLEAAARAVAKANGYRYSGDSILARMLRRHAQAGRAIRRSPQTWKLRPAMDMNHLIPMILSLPAEDKEHIRAALAVDAAGGTEALAVLDLPMGDNDANAATVRGYLKALLTKLWEEGEGFSGKRPFGNSGWERDLHFPLVKAGRVAGEIERERLESIEDKDAADQMIFEAIDQL